MYSNLNPQLYQVFSTASKTFFFTSWNNIWKAKSNFVHVQQHQGTLYHSFSIFKSGKICIFLFNIIWTQHNVCPCNHHIAGIHFFFICPCMRLDFIMFFFIHTVSSLICFCLFFVRLSLLIVPLNV